MSIRQWIYPDADPDAVAALRTHTGQPELVCRILCARGLASPEAAADFLQTSRPPADPHSLRDMDRAVETIRSALEEGRRIAVYGDYDCDGITSTALLVSYLQSVGADVFYYVPDRETEGYGMNRGAVDKLEEQGAELVITVDNGISAHDEIAYAAQKGIGVVVTDHHTPQETLPDALAVVNPHRRDCRSGLTELAGVGVAFKLVCALEEDDGTELMEYYSDLVMLGTVADVMPLVGENRAIVSHGLRRLADTERAGLDALMQVSGVAGKGLTSESAAFSVIPRLNASGRMGSVDEAVQLLLTDDVPYANELAASIDALNTQRKQIEEEIVRDIEARIAAEPGLLRHRLLIVSGEGWHHGVVGIAAARIMERYGKPVILFSTDGEEARGSGRSIAGFSLIEAVSACAEHLIRYGGHPLAAGMTAPVGQLADFIDSIQAVAARTHPQMPLPRCEIDCELRPAELRIEAIASLAALEPFGAGNRQPLFLLRGLTIDRVLPTSDRKHIRVRFTAGNAGFFAVFFRMTEERFAYGPGDVVDAVAQVGVSEYNGAPQLSIKLQDVRLSGVEQEALIRDGARYDCHLRAEYGAVCEREDLLPTREDIALVWRYLRAHSGYRHSRAELYFRLGGRPATKQEPPITYAKMLVALDVLEELGLVSECEQNGVRGIWCAQGPQRVELSASAILRELSKEKVVN